MEEDGILLRLTARTGEITAKTIFKSMAYSLNKVMYEPDTSISASNNNNELVSVPVGDDVNDIKKALQKEGVNFSIFKANDGTENSILNFYGKDSNKIYRAFENVLADKELHREPITDKMNRAAKKAVDLKVNKNLKPEITK